MEGVIVKHYATEEELLLAWRDLVVVELDLDMLTGHNIFKFDLNYIGQRAKVLGLDEFFQLGKIKERMTAVRSVESQSKAFGHTEFHYLPMTGRFQVDVYTYQTLDTLRHCLPMTCLLPSRRTDLKPHALFSLCTRSFRFKFLVHRTTHHE